MARVIGKLTTKGVAAAPVGLHGDGGGLWLQVTPSGRSWTYRYKSPATGRAREMGLGSAATIALPRARELAAAARSIVQNGRDPIEDRRAVEQVGQAPRAPTFAEAAAQYIEAKRAGWRSEKHASQWHATLSQHAYPALGTKPIDQIGTEDVLGVLKPIWTAIPETAVRVRGRIELILSFSKARGWRSGENPAAWRGHLDHVLPARSKVAPVVHRAAVVFNDIGTVMARLAESSGTGALAVRFLTLTAARSAEVRGAAWSEIDLAAKIWTVPAVRMKGGREHRVPLAEGAIAILQEADRRRALAGGGHYVFPGGRASSPLSDVALSKALHIAAGSKNVTVHGLRSTFRDWAGETTSFPREIAEAALAHVNKDKVEAAYRRGDALERRRRLMDAWSAFCTRPAGERGVVPLRRRAGA